MSYCVRCFARPSNPCRKPQRDRPSGRYWRRVLEAPTAPALGSFPKTESIRAVRDEAVLGIARFFGDALRLYGQFGYSFSPSDTLVGKVPVRYDWGLEYSPPVPPRGGPFAAFDMDFRAEQDFFRNITIQAGWQWKTNENRRSSARIGVEHYDGNSPYGQFFEQRESYWALVGIFDW